MQVSGPIIQGAIPAVVDGFLRDVNAISRILFFRKLFLRRFSLLYYDNIFTVPRTYPSLP